MTTLLRDEQLVGVAAGTWRALLAEDLHAVDAPAAPAGSTVTGCVHLSGAWTGAVLLTCGLDLARRAAGVMFHLNPAALSDDEVCDGFGELTNIVGGGVKALLPGPSTLSLPSVTEGSSYSVRVPGEDLQHRLDLQTPSGSLLLCVWKA